MIIVVVMMMMMIVVVSDGYGDGLLREGLKLSTVCPHGWV